MKKFILVYCGVSAICDVKDLSVFMLFNSVMLLKITRARALTKPIIYQIHLDHVFFRHSASLAFPFGVL